MEREDLPNMSEKTSSSFRLETVRQSWTWFFSPVIMLVSLERYLTRSLNSRMSAGGIKEGLTSPHIYKSQIHLASLRICNAYAGKNPGFVEEYPQIKSLAWAPGSGNVGFEALGKIFSGEVNPSGKTNDTFVYDIDKVPYYNNAEKTDYENLKDMTMEGMNSGVATTYSPSFINYVEGIYVGYKFYETAAEEEFIEYDEVVQYSFGYGLSYTMFEQTIGELSVSGGIMGFDVTVTNTGDKAGKYVVEVYYNPPYTNGGIEKASANLVDFAKMGILEPGKPETIHFEFDEEEMASYDDVAAVNLFEDALGDVTYLSRKDGFANYEEATAAPTNLDMPEEYAREYHLNANYNPSAYIDDSDEMPVTGKNNGLKLVNLRGKDYDDPMWDDLLD